MTRYVIEPSVALALAERNAGIPNHHKLLAPTLLRSQVLAELYVRVQRGELSKKHANQRLDYLRGLQVRLLGDRVLQRVAWDIAQELGWKDTFVAEYLALTNATGRRPRDDGSILGDGCQQVDSSGEVRGSAQLIAALDVVFCAA